MPFKVDFKMNVILTKNLSLDEVSKCKALGLDGIPTKFFKKHLEAMAFVILKAFS
jgi:hypothetical protein